jgi:ornithine decarboxylase
VEHELSRHVGVEVFDILGETVPLFVNSRIEAGFENASFLVTNLAPVVAQFVQWKAELPMVDPFYAVKCNPDPVIVRLLASLGCNFDCATMGEIDLVLNGLGDELSFSQRGCAESSIVYANPAKMVHMLDFAVKNNVRMTVFDGEDELHKIATVKGHENFQLLLRLTTDDKASICRFSKKFGCPVEEAPRLLEVAKSLGLNIAGVSFHVGSGCGDSDAYTTALLHARRVFDEAERIGMSPLHIIDLGGGFPGDAGGYGGPGMPTFQDLARAIREGIKGFTEDLVRPAHAEPLRFIAEPGRYFVSASTTIATKIYSRKGGNNAYQALYVDDGVYGSFNNVVYDHATPVPRQLSLAVSEDKLAIKMKAFKGTSPVSVADVIETAVDAPVGIPSAVFGPTCDGLDQMCSLETTFLPRCQVGEWLIWENQGAYTHTASFVFNGYTHVPKKTYCFL